MPKAWRILKPCTDHEAVACAFDLLILDSDDLRRRPLSERKAAFRKVLFRIKGGIQYVEHAQGHGAEMFAAVRSAGRRHLNNLPIDLASRKAGSKSKI